MAPVLSPPRRVQTNVPFPEFVKGANLPTVEPSASDKVTIESCAEFLDQYVSGSRFGSKSDSKLMHDVNGQPMVLSIGSDQHLYLYVYINGALGGWSAVDINPSPSFEAKVFDAAESINGKGQAIVVSGRGSDKNRTEVWQAILNTPSFVVPKDGDVNLSSITKLPWIQTGDSIAQRNIQSLACTPLPNSRYRTVAAVDATSNLEGSYFVLDSSSAQQGWTPLRLAQQVETVLSCSHGYLPKLGQGEFVLFQDASAQKETACLFQGSGGAAKGIFLSGLARPKSLSTSVNERGLTDLWIATEDGLGYVNHMKLGEAPERLLPGIEFTKVFAAESRTVGDASKLLIYALSSHGELYVVEGRRSVADKKQVQFQASQVPIRSDIRAIAGSINPSTSASEIVYVSRENDSLFHLARDPISCLWKETELVVKAKEPMSKVKVAAYVVNISFTNGKGLAVPPGFKVQLTSGACLAYVNDRTYNLDQRPQVVSTDQLGRLQIIVPTSGGLGAAPIGIRFQPESAESRVFYIQPAQRVLDSLGSIKTGDDLKNAKTWDGRPLFTSTENHSQENFDQVAQAFANVPAVITAVDPAAVPGSQPAPSNVDTTIVWQKAKGPPDNDKSWLDSAVDVVGNVIGDAIELLKKGVKAIVKVALRIAGPIIRLVLKVGVRVIRFVLDTVSTVVTGLANLLEGVFGLDLSFITDFFKFRYKRVAETQKDLTFAIESAITLSSRYLHHHRGSLIDGIDTIGKFFESIVGQPTTLPIDTSGAHSSEGFFDNPIISNLLKFNPLSWIMEAIAEELGDDIKIPSLRLDLLGQAWAALKEQFGLLWKFLQNSWTTIRAVISEPASVMERLQSVLREGFWTIFNAIKAIIIRTFDLFLSSYDAITDFCRGKWVIPFVTDLWEELTDCDFTLINFVTYVAAQILEIANPGKQSLASKWNLRSTFANLEKSNMPPLLPKSWTGDDDESQLSFEQQLAMSKQAQAIGKEEMAKNPSQTPQFRLMMAPSPTTKSEYPSSGVQIAVALARAGKKASRCVNLVVEGLYIGEGSIEDWGSDRSTSVSSGATRASTNASLNPGSDGDLSFSFLSDSSQDSQGEISAKNILIGSNTFACICQITEQVLLYNEYDKTLREKENFDGNCVELATGVFGLLTSLVADSPQIMALSNFINSGGSLSGRCFQPDKNAYSYISMGAFACLTVSSIVFLVKEPTCQGIGWGGTGLGVMGNMVDILKDLDVPKKE